VILRQDEEVIEIQRAVAVRITGQFEEVKLSSALKRRTRSRVA
jgi:hypothetical protein